MELRIRDVSKTYPNGVHALDHVTLTTPAGMYGLPGPSGAGKSTLMRIPATLREPDSGSVTPGEIDVLKEKDRLRETLSDRPQELFEPAERDPEDASFSAMAGRHRARHEVTA